MPQPPQTSARRRSAFLKTALGVLVLAAIAVGFWSRAEIQEQRVREIAEGKRLFQLSCCGCHNGRITGVEKIPPNLAGLFTRPRLPSGAPAIDAEVRSTILLGRANIMPSFRDVLTSEQIDEIIRYLHTTNAQTYLCPSN